jgi:hypothetical protein
MVDIKELAIADCLKHSTFGVLSHQPMIFDDSPNDLIRVKDRSGRVFWLEAKDCRWASEEEVDEYWKDLKAFETSNLQL